MHENSEEIKSAVENQEALKQGAPMETTAVLECWLIRGPASRCRALPTATEMDPGQWWWVLHADTRHTTHDQLCHARDAVVRGHARTMLYTEPQNGEHSKNA
jgi:hypothetical protein